jgi:hypothetical protein
MYVSSGTVDITSANPLVLGGSWSRRGPVMSRGAGDQLEANVCLLSDNGQETIILSIDALFVGPDISRDLTDSVSSLLGNADYRPDILPIATHTHGAPMLDRSKPLLGERCESWYREVIARLAEEIVRLRERAARGVMVSLADRDIPGGVNRRCKIKRPVLSGRRVQLSGVIMGANREVPVPSSCNAALVCTSDRRRVCVFICWACHPSSHPPPNQVSADYVGAMRRSVRSVVGDIPVLFLQGFSGDVRSDIRTRPTFGRWIYKSVRGPVFDAPTPEEWNEWATGVAQEVRFLAQDLVTKPSEAARSLALGRAYLPISSILEGDDPRACEAVWLAIGSAVSLFMIGAEVSSNYSAYVRQMGAWPVSCFGDVFGYLPTDDQIVEGGYEVDRFQKVFGIAGKFRGQNEMYFRLLLQTANDRCRAAGRSASDGAGTRVG